MVATAIYFVTMVLWKETTFPHIELDDICEISH